MQQVSSRTRRPRADGERNRARLIAAAEGAFAEKGAAVSLEHIAREADVSIATLYRHFPTRDELIAAVYQQEVTVATSFSRRTCSMVFEPCLPVLHAPVPSFLIE